MTMQKLPIERLAKLSRRTAPTPQLQVVPVRHWGRIVGGAITVLIVAALAWTIASSPNIKWSVVGDYLFDHNVLTGLLRTLEMTVVASVIALVLAAVIGVMRTSESRIIAGFAAGWVFFFRGIPIIVLLIFIGNIGLFAHTLTLRVPFTGIVLWSEPASQVFTPFVASVIGLALAGSGYMAESVRAGLLSVGRGQHDAAKAVGLTSFRTLRYIVIPQAMRVILPPLGNEFIGLLKASAIVSVIAGGDLLTVILGYSSTNYRTIEMLIVATIWYMLTIAALSLGQRYVEHKVRER